MTKQQKQGSVWALGNRDFILLGLMIVAISNVAWSAPGDVRASFPVPSCTGAAVGVAFDGRIIYYTKTNSATALIYRLEAATASDLGSAEVMDGAVPLRPLGGLAWDPNRGVLWAVADRMYQIDVGSWTVKGTYTLMNNIWSQSVAYDFTRDVIWARNHVGGRAECYRPDGEYCGGRPDNYPDDGLTHDGVDLWHYTGDYVHVPVPFSEGVLFPTVNNAPQAARAYDIPDKDYWDMAYDCVTFDKPVIWIGHRLQCMFYAFEIETQARCLQPSMPLRVARVDLTGPRPSQLPPTLATSARVFGTASPVRVSDAEYPLVDPDGVRPRALFYALLGPGGGPAPGVLKAVKDGTAEAVVVTD